VVIASATERSAVKAARKTLFLIQTGKDVRSKKPLEKRYLYALKCK